MKLRSDMDPMLTTLNLIDLRQKLIIFWVKKKKKKTLTAYRHNSYKNGKPPNPIKSHPPLFSLSSTSLFFSLDHSPKSNLSLPLSKAKHALSLSLSLSLSLWWNPNFQFDPQMPPPNNKSMMMNTRPGRIGGDSDESETPSNNLWVGNLASDVADSDLMDLFAQYGALDSVTSYSSRSYAFVFFKWIEDAKATKDTLQGADLHGHPIKIEFARPVCSHQFVLLLCVYIYIYIC